MSSPRPPAFRQDALARLYAALGVVLLAAAMGLAVAGAGTLAGALALAGLITELVAAALASLPPPRRPGPP